MFFISFSRIFYEGKSFQTLQNLIKSSIFHYSKKNHRKFALILQCLNLIEWENSWKAYKKQTLVPDDQSKWGYMPWLLELQKIFIFLFVILLGANGIVICCIFTFNSRIYGLYRKWFTKRSNVGQFPRSIRSWNRNRKISSMSTITNTTSLYY